MKTKICAICKIEETTLFRVQIEQGKIWIFVCETCCKKSQHLPHYRYGGTWKGYRHG
jgi:protein-arginine kinase activator protein McsA